MKKISGGQGKEIEVSDDVTDDIDPESMLEESNLEPARNHLSSNSEIDDPQIFSTIYLVHEDKELKITGLFRKLSFKNGGFEYEFVLLKKKFLELLDFSSWQIHKIVFRSEENEYNLTTEIKQLKHITFESFGKQIKCCLAA